MEEDIRKSLIAKLHEGSSLTESERSYLLGVLNEHKGYGLLWEDHPELVEEHLRTSLPVLDEVPERRIVSDDPQAPCHSIIEGDNLEALTTLSFTHAGRVDVIYIDPPYNTGNKDFVYNDRFVDHEDAFRHSKWLSFMSKRLRIAKKLLSDHGVIFISIGDDEVAQLIMLCKEIFGEKNYIETYIWNSTTRPDNSSTILRRNAEFVLCIAKNSYNISEFRGVISKTSGMPSLTKLKEKIKTIIFPAGCVKTNLEDGTYMAGVKDNGKNSQWQLMEDAVVLNGEFVSPVILRGHSYWSTQEKIETELSNGTEIWIKSETFVPYYKKSKESITRPTKILPTEIVGDGLSANAELNGNLFGKKVFNNPKPTTLISFLINFIPSSIILDFFAGSGTTLHAVMQLNSEDGGHRQCILVTNNENGICEDVTWERNRRVIEGYAGSRGPVAGLAGNSLRYYRTAFVARRREARRELVRRATDLLRLMHDIYDEAPLAGLGPSAARLFASADGREMLIVYDEERLADVVSYLSARGEHQGPRIKTYVFSGNDYTYDSDFSPVADMVELCALPQAILDAYKEVLPPPGEATAVPPPPGPEGVSAEGVSAAPGAAQHKEERP